MNEKQTSMKARMPTPPGGTTKATNAATNKPINRAHIKASKTILRTVTIFLASGKRNSSNQSKSSNSSKQKRSKQKKMDELTGKINPKILESFRKKTKFTK